METKELEWPRVLKLVVGTSKDMLAVRSYLLCHILFTEVTLYDINMTAISVK